MALIAGKDQSGIPRSVNIDPITRFLVAIDGAEHRTHLGRQFFAQHIQSVAANNAITAMAFTTPATNYVHMIVEGQSTDQAEFKLIETPSIDEAEATAVIVPYNRFRDSTLTSGMFDAEPVKATGKITFTGDVSDGDTITIGADTYEFDILIGNITPGNIYVDMVGPDRTAANAEAQLIISMDASDTAGINPTADGGGTAVDLEADAFGEAFNYVMTTTGANITLGQLLGGVGAINTGKDTEIHGAANSISVYDNAEATTANITTTVALIDEIVGQAAATPARDSQHGISRGAAEWILGRSSQYCLYMKSLNANANTHNIDCHWYETPHLSALDD